MSSGKRSSELPTSRAAPDPFGEDAFDDEGDRSFLLPFGLEPAEDKTRKSSYQLKRRMWVVIGGISAGLIVIGLLVVLLEVLRRGATPPLMDFQCPPGLDIRSTDEVFFVVGDWGRQGNANQMRAARLMARVATECMHPDFIISSGDNFYESGLTAVQDPQIDESFNNVYSDPSLQVDWYAVLGNHDYGESDVSKKQLLACPRNVTQAADLASCQSSCCYSPLWQVSEMGSQTNSALPRWQLRQGAYQKKLGSVEFTFIDTSPALSKYQDKSWAQLPGGILSQNASHQRTQVEALLSSSSTPLKIVVGHHPVRSYGEHCAGADSDCDEMQAWLDGLLQRYNVTAYMCGHEHNLQYIKRPDDRVAYVVSGAGSDVRHDWMPLPSDGETWMHDDQGFVSVLVREGQLTLYYWFWGSPPHVVQLGQ